MEEFQLKEQNSEKTRERQLRIRMILNETSKFFGHEFIMTYVDSFISIQYKCIK